MSEQILVESLSYCRCVSAIGSLCDGFLLYTRLNPKDGHVMLCGGW